MKENSNLMKRIARELKEITENPPDNCSAGPITEDNMTHWIATIIGPKDSPYENGLFHLDIFFPPEYPFKKPSIFFKTRIFHPNIDSRGRICLDTINERWSPIFTISKALLSICSLLDDPNPDDPFNPDAADLYKKDRKKYIETVTEWVNIYAS